MYSKLLAETSTETPKITDKMPPNFQRLGIIRMLFPKAKVIHCRRDPIDTCLSIYTTPLRGSDFLYDRSNIVFAYQEYLRLMEHWRKVLESDFLFEVDYEALIADREPAIRDMVNFVGLEWDDACLSHEDNERAVTTPSRWQARQRLYSTSVERWRRFSPWLGEFKKLLG